MATIINGLVQKSRTEKLQDKQKMFDSGDNSGLTPSEISYFQQQKAKNTNITTPQTQTQTETKKTLNIEGLGNTPSMTKAFTLPKEETVSKTPTPTVATAEKPIRTISSTTATAEPVVEKSNRDKQIDITMKTVRSQGGYPELNDEELRFLIDSKIPKEADTSALTNIQSQMQSDIATAESQLTENKAKMLTENQQKLADYDAQLEAQLGIDTAKIEQAGEKRKEETRKTTSFSGFGRSTSNMKQIDEIQASVNDSIDLLNKTKEAEKRAYQMKLEGASDEAISSAMDTISQMKNQLNEWSYNIAQQTAELNAQNQVSTSEAIDNILSAMPTNNVSGQKIDKDISEMLGYISDEYGNPVITDNDGNPVNIMGSASGAEYKTVTDPVTGQIYFYNPKDPTSILPLGNQSLYYSPITNINGQQSSANTSYTGGMVDVTNQYGGNKLKHADNCALFARDNVPNLPYGADSVSGRINGIRQAEQQGFGSFDMSQVRVGDAIHTKEGSVGHSAIVKGFDQNGNMILEEANYKSGKITYGRTLNPNDDVVIGWVRPTSSAISQNQIKNSLGNLPYVGNVIKNITGLQNEQSAPAIESQLGLDTETTISDPFLMKQYNDYLTSGKEPSYTGTTYQKQQQQQEFIKNAKIFYGQKQRGEVPLETYDPEAYAKLEKEFPQNAYVKALKLETSIIPKMKQYRDLVEKNGFEYVGGDKQLMDSLWSDITTTWKDIKGLGALTGPDMALAESALPKAHSVLGNIGKSITLVSPQDVINTYDDWISKAEKETESNINIINSIYSDLKGSTLLNEELNKYYDYKGQSPTAQTQEVTSLSDIWDTL